MRKIMQMTVTYGLYPVLLAGVLAIIMTTVWRGNGYGKVYGITTLGLVGVLILTVIKLAIAYVFDLGEKRVTSG